LQPFDRNFGGGAITAFAAFKMGQPPNLDFRGCY
jgi:hypothetical protein